MFLSSASTRLRRRRPVSMRMMICGGALVPEPLLRSTSIVVCRSSRAYGPAETRRWHVPHRRVSLTKLGSAGAPPPVQRGPHLRRRQRHDRRTEVRGEVCTRGPNVLLGYWNRLTPPPRRSTPTVSTPAHRLPRRRRVPLHRRPGEGHGDLGRRERLPGRGRERAVAHPQIAEVADRSARRALGRSRHRDRRRQGSRFRRSMSCASSLASRCPPGKLPTRCSRSTLPLTRQARCSSTSCATASTTRSADHTARRGCRVDHDPPPGSSA